MCRGVRVQDEWTYFCGIWLKNRSIVIVLAIAQFIVATVSLAQHVYSVVNFNKIFLCSFNETSPNAGNFLSADVIIFDFGLFHELIQVQECIANYLDGGYMRCLWCLGQMAALALTIGKFLASFMSNLWSGGHPQKGEGNMLRKSFHKISTTRSRRMSMISVTCLGVSHPHPLLLWPQLIIQNAYCFGLVILTIATADKLLVSILHPVNPHLSLLILYFGIGTCTNHVFDYILWHYYWHEEYQYITRTGKHVIPFWV
ncbi:unnamed protein product [Nippostrongylus brasiliensis]|uniref:Polyprenol reductase n=1 Tax=Nippostrongylus brasiliensis TaxID=27835 RepID=A0A0N4YMK6_NIPBR|nr:unnamed protein product [Nippostrongylus brasiliensis]